MPGTAPLRSSGTLTRERSSLSLAFAAAVDADADATPGSTASNVSPARTAIRCLRSTAGH